MRKKELRQIQRVLRGFKLPPGKLVFVPKFRSIH